eukprot:scaffold14.g1296.t1
MQVVSEVLTVAGNLGPAPVEPAPRTAAAAAAPAPACTLAEGTVVRCTQTGVIYKVEGGQRRWFTAAAYRAANFPPYQTVADCARVLLCPAGLRMPEAPSVPAACPVAEGAAVQCSSTGFVYRLTSGLLRRFSAAGYAAAGKPAFARLADCSGLLRCRIGPMIEAAEGPRLAPSPSPVPSPPPPRQPSPSPSPAPSPARPPSPSPARPPSPSPARPPSPSPARPPSPSPTPTASPSPGLPPMFPLNGIEVPQLPPGALPRPRMWAEVAAAAGGPRCFASGSARAPGARGDGAANDGPALAAAAAATGYLFLPVGSYRIASSMRISVPVIMGANTRFTLDAGVTLTLTRQPHRPPRRGDPLVGGTGWLRFDGPGIEARGGRHSVSPDWGGAASRSRERAGVGGVFSTLATQLIGNPMLSTGQGLALRPGRYSLPIYVTMIRNFADFGFGAVSMNSDGFRLDATSGSSRAISNVTIEHFSKNQNTVVFVGNTGAETYRDVLVRGNFVVAGGQDDGRQNLQSAGVLFRGAPPVLSGTGTIFQAIDPAQASAPPPGSVFITKTQFAGLQTLTSGPVANVYFRVDTWNGGYVGPPGRVIDGWFTNLQAQLGAAVRAAAREAPLPPPRARHNAALLGLASLPPAAPPATQTPPTPRFSKFTQGDGDSYASNYYWVNGTGNRITESAVGSAGAESRLSATPGLYLFNGGRPWAQQLKWAAVPVTTDWAPGEVRTFYLYQIAVRVANLSPRVVAASTWGGAFTFRFGVQAGP